MSGKKDNFVAVLDDKPAVVVGREAKIPGWDRELYITNLNTSGDKSRDQWSVSDKKTGLALSMGKYGGTSGDALWKAKELVERLNNLDPKDKAQQMKNLAKFDKKWSVKVQAHYEKLGAA